jgi:AraC-like DNA-binding protein
MPPGSLIPASAAPPWARQFRSDNLEEVRALIGNKDGPHARVAQGDRPLGYAMFQVSAPHTNLGGSESGLAQVVRGHVHGWVLHLALPPGTVLRSGLRASAPSRPATAALVPPGWALTRISPPGRLFAAEVDPQALMAELQARRPDQAHRSLRRLAMLELAPGERCGLQAAASDLVRATEPGTDPRSVALAEGRFIAQVVDLALRDAVVQRPGDLAIERARNLEAWIDAHLETPITLGTLCQVAGVGARCLQKSFLYRRGISPMRFVTERRLLAAHQWLAAGADAATVTEAALRFGFMHLGRFSVAYRQAIGELPSQTLAAARRMA